MSVEHRERPPGRIIVAKFTGPLPAELNDDAVLETALLPDEGHSVRTRPEPDWALIDQELRPWQDQLFESSPKRALTARTLLPSAASPRYSPRARRLRARAR